jgi:DNA modification methylase
MALQFVKEHDYAKVLPFDDDRRSIDVFGWKPFSIHRPTPESKAKWKEVAYFDDGEIDIRPDGRGIRDENGVGKMSEFHAGLCENIVRYWSLKGAKVVDPFAGRVTRATVTTLLNREYYGYEITPNTYNRALKHFEKHNINPTLYKSDGCKLEHTEDEFADLVLTCPPYYNVEQYESCDGQLSDIKGYENFMVKMNECVGNVKRVLKSGGFAVFVVGDFRRDGGLQNFHGDLINQFKGHGMQHWDTIVMENITPFAAMQLYKVNCKRFTSKIHEYVLVFRKPGDYIVPDYCEIEMVEDKINNWFN